MASFHDFPLEVVYRIVHFVGQMKHSQAETQQFLVSPIAIAFPFIDIDFRRLTLARYADLRSLALTCCFTAIPAQQELFKKAAIDNFPRNMGRRTTSMHSFISAIFRRSDLANQVSELHIDLHAHVDSHVIDWTAKATEMRKARPCCDGKNVDWCHFGCLVDLCKRLIQTWHDRETSMSLNIAQQGRLRFYWVLTEGLNTHHLKWFAIVGTLLHMLPQIQNVHSRTGVLSINTLQTSPWNQGFWFSEESWITRLLTSEFCCLTVLKVSFVPFWAVLQTPTLRKIHFNLTDIDTLYQSRIEGPEGYQIPEDEQCHHIKDMVIDIHPEVLENFKGGRNRRCKNGADKVIQKLQRHLSKLKRLEIRLVYKLHPMSRTFDKPRDQKTACLTYEFLSELLKVPSLESICIDASDVDWICFRPKFVLHSVTPHPVHLARQSILPFAHDWADGRMVKSGNLKRFVVPQELLFQTACVVDGYHRFEMIAIPDSVESIEIIDSTELLNEWVGFVLRRRDLFPNLQRIVLWCDKFSSPLGRDYTYEAYYGIERTEEDKIENLDDFRLWLAEAYRRMLLLQERGIRSNLKWYQNTGPSFKGYDMTTPPSSRPPLLGDGVWLGIQWAGVGVDYRCRREQGWREL